MSAPEKYLRPEVIHQVSRLDLRAKLIVEGFLAGLHASPYHGFSVEFSEHRKYVPGDDLKDLDWNVFAKTDKYYLKKFEAETNVTGYLVMDLSGSMNWDGRTEAEKAGIRLLTPARAAAAGRMTKFEYGICLAAALAYLMIHQQDPVGLVTFDTRIQTVLPPHSKRTQLGTLLSVLANLKPTGQTDVGGCLHQLAALMRARGLVLLFSDLLTDPDPVLQGLHHLRHRGNAVIMFHILDEVEVHFPLAELIEFEDVETPARLPATDARGLRDGYLRDLGQFQEFYRTECAKANIDYVPMDTGVGFDRALMEYLLQRKKRF